MRPHRPSTTWLEQMGPMKGIYRIDENGMCGWNVFAKRRKQSHGKYFPDGPGGPPASLSEAIAWRNELLRRLPPPTKAWMTPGRDKHDVRGVKREVSVNSSGNLAECWRAQWVEVNGRVGRRSFSVHKFGEKEARAMAIVARRENLARVLRERQQLLLTNVVGAGPITRRRRRSRLPAAPAADVTE